MEMNEWEGKLNSKLYQGKPSRLSIPISKPKGVPTAHHHCKFIININNE
jgi:hypothetical protein